MTDNTLLQPLSDADSSDHQFLLQKGSNPHAE
jgi:hypothetical protein